MQRDDEFADLMSRVQNGCEQSIGLLLDRYGPYILIAVRRRLSRQLRSKFDSLDFVQDVWASFFTDIPTRFAFGGPDDLVALLTRMAHNKVAETVRTRMQRQKYNVNREQPIDPDPERLHALRADLATPSEIVMGREEWDNLLEKQPLVHRRILSMVREGSKPIQIAEKLELSVRTVRRVIQKNLPGAAT